MDEKHISGEYLPPTRPGLKADPDATPYSFDVTYWVRDNNAIGASGTVRRGEATWAYEVRSIRADEGADAEYVVCRSITSEIDEKDPVWRGLV